MIATVISFPSMKGRRETPAAANRVGDLRKARGWSQADLGVAIGLSVTHISRIENGHRDLNQYWMEKIASAPDVRPADLLSTAHGGLSAAERELIDTYREIPAASRQAFDALRESQQPYRAHGEVVSFPPRRDAG